MNETLSAYSVLGSISPDDFCRRLAIAPPPGTWRLIKEHAPPDAIRQFVSRLSAHDRRLFFLAEMTNFHELCHYRHFLGTVVGLQLVETAIEYARTMFQALRYVQVREMPLLLNNRRHVPGEVRKYLRAQREEYHFHFEGIPRLPKYSRFLDMEGVARSRRFPSIFGRIELCRPFIYVGFDPQGKCLPGTEDSEAFYIGGRALFESAANHLENLHGSLMLSQFLGYRPEWFPASVPLHYTLFLFALYEAFPHLLSDGADQSELQKLQYSVCALTLNPGVKEPTRNNPCNLPGLKFWRILDALENLGQSDSDKAIPLDAIDSELVARHGYASLAEAIAGLKRNNQKRREYYSQPWATSSMFAQSCLDFYVQQEQVLDADGAMTMFSDQYIAEGWTTLAKPPLTFNKTDSARPKLIAVARDMARGFVALVYLFGESTVRQALFGREIHCPLKAGGVFCPRSTSKCGLVTSLSAQYHSRGCLFERAVNGVSGKQPDAVGNEGLEFAEELLTKEPT